MKRNTKTQQLVRGALIGALYAALCYLQNVLLPGTTSNTIQFRVAEALCVLAFFTPAAIPGLTVGCVLFNVSMAGAMPLDTVLGGLATLLAAWGMYRLRKVTVKGIPVPGLLLPAITNGVLIGLELWYLTGISFWVNALYVAIGEVAVLLTLGVALYLAVQKRRLLEN